MAGLAAPGDGLHAYFGAIRDRIRSILVRPDCGVLAERRDSTRSINHSTDSSSPFVFCLEASGVEAA